MRFDWGDEVAGGMHQLVLEFKRKGPIEVVDDLRRNNDNNNNRQEVRQAAYLAGTEELSIFVVGRDMKTGGHDGVLYSAHHGPHIARLGLQPRRVCLRRFNLNSRATGGGREREEQRYVLLAVACIHLDRWSFDRRNFVQRRPNGVSLACGEYPAVSSLCYMPQFKKLTLVGRTEEGGRPGIVLVRAWFPCGGAEAVEIFT